MSLIPSQEHLASSRGQHGTLEGSDLRFRELALAAGGEGCDGVRERPGQKLGICARDDNSLGRRATGWKGMQS